ncbi:MAG: hypothetical protein QOD30_548 [Actinomycetota bacterium]|jgi:hypothetical protein|nr:hypothetical protein [Actinomycetota bacterium]
MVAAEPPIACSLGADEVAGRIDEWQSVLAAVTSRSAIDGGLRLTFEGAPLAELARLAVAEHDCCRFFAFAITVDERGVALEVRAPERARELVASVFGAPT